MSQVLAASPLPVAPAATGLRRPARVLGAVHPIHRLSPDAQGAWGSTLFAAMPPQVTASLLERAVEVALEPGEIFYRRAHHAETALCAVVIDGLLRVTGQVLVGGSA
ncbi:hypothetical protein [Micromonospora sp. NPDC023814]|uniref:hypothetical protein n=1 Tax=Micromonospora sp. NPDC023814 TaxID=3154596 RepID=UPI0033FE2BAA